MPHWHTDWFYCERQATCGESETMYCSQTAAGYLGLEDSLPDHRKAPTRSFCGRRSPAARAERGSRRGGRRQGCPGRVANDSGRLLAPGGVQRRISSESEPLATARDWHPQARPSEPTGGTDSRDPLLVQWQDSEAHWQVGVCWQKAQGRLEGGTCDLKT